MMRNDESEPEGSGQVAQVACPLPLLLVQHSAGIMPPKTTSKSHSDLAKEAILALKERTGSSLAAIKTWIAKTYPSVKVVPHLLNSALKKGVESKKFVKVKASYKLAASEKKPKKASKPKAVKKSPGKKKPAAKKPAAAPAEGEAAAPKVGAYVGW